MTKNRTHVVKRYHSGGDSVVMTGSEEACQERADDLNSQYQTDEYRVEPYRMTLATTGWNLRKVVVNSVNTMKGGTK